MLKNLTYANAMATFAVFIALGGASYAAVTLSANSVGTKQLKRGAVTGAKVKPGSLLASNFRRGQLPAGAQGPAGAKGDTGPAGPKGDTGAAGAPGSPAGFPATLPAGRTETGAWGSEDKSSAGDGYATSGISFNIPLATAPTPVVVPAASTMPHCTGTALLPTADPGFLCVYIGGSSSTPIVFSPDGGDAATAGTTGALVGLHNPVDAWGYGSWAATA